MTDQYQFIDPLTTMDKQWIRSLQSSIASIMLNIIPNKKAIGQYVDNNAMEIWKKAFVHESIDATNNYEELEYLGDAILKSVFPKYLVRRIPNLSESRYTELYRYYMSKMEQAKLIDELGLAKFIKTAGPISTNMKADVSESFFGALDTVSEMITNGLGYINCNNMIVYLFSDKNLDMDQAEGAPKTLVQQIFSRFEFDAKNKNPIEEYSDDPYDPKRHIFNIFLTDTQMDFLVSHGINGLQAHIGSAFGNTKKSAETEAYKDALNTLKRVGVTTEWASNIKRRLDFNKIDSDLLNDAYTELNRIGLTDFDFVTPKKTVSPNSIVFILRGIDENGKSYNLRVLLVNKDPSKKGNKGTDINNNAKFALIQNFVNDKDFNDQIHEKIIGK